MSEYDVVVKGVVGFCERQRNLARNRLKRKVYSMARLDGVREKVARCSKRVARLLTEELNVGPRRRVLQCRRLTGELSR